MNHFFSKKSSSTGTDFPPMVVAFFAAIGRGIVGGDEGDVLPDKMRRISYVAFDLKSKCSKFNETYNYSFSSPRCLIIATFLFRSSLFQW